MANKEVAHIAALEPAKSNAGFVGTISLNGDTEKSFAVLLADEANGAQRAAIVSAAHEQLRALRPEPTLYERVSSKLRGAFGLRETFRQPKDVTLKSVKQVENALRKGIEAPGDSFTILCRSRECYAELCAAIGITRTDHMVNAELSSLLDNEKPKKNKVVGHAHRLFDRLAQAKTQEHRLPERDEFMQGVTQHFLDGIPDAQKFYLGDRNFKGTAKHRRVTPEDLRKPDNYRLPYEICLFESHVVGLAHDDNPAGVNEYFYLATQTDDDSYAAEIVQICPDKVLAFREYVLFWNVGGKTLVPSFKPYAAVVSDYGEAANCRDSLFHFRNLLLAIEHINNPTTRLTPHDAPRARPVPIGKRKRSPFYDCYDVSLPSGGSVRRLGDAFASGRVVRAHERIRHQRTYKHPRYVNVRGKTVWIDAMQVGDPKNGVVAKGYNLSSAP